MALELPRCLQMCIFHYQSSNYTITWCLNRDLYLWLCSRIFQKAPWINSNGNVAHPREQIFGIWNKFTTMPDPQEVNKFQMNQSMYHAYTLQNNSMLKKISWSKDSKGFVLLQAFSAKERSIIKVKCFSMVWVNLWKISSRHFRLKVTTLKNKSK